MKRIREWIRQLYLNMGAYFLRKGAGFQPGAEIKLATAVSHGMKGHKVRRGVKTIYVKNMRFNFLLNKIVYEFTHVKPKVVLKAEDDTSTER